MIIADACNNHLGDIRIISKMIELCPADFIKFQLYDPEELSDEWKGEYDYYKTHALSDEMVMDIREKCRSKGIEPMFTLFSPSQIPRAKRLAIRAVKVASPNAGVNYLTTECALGFEKCIISTGMCNDAERLAIGKAFDSGEIILYCISRYPCVWTEEERGKALLWDGISDHSKDIDTALWAVRNGLWVERHYTLGKDLPGKDHAISSLPGEFQTLVNERNYLRNVERYKNRWTKRNPALTAPL